MSFTIDLMVQNDPINKLVKTPTPIQTVGGVLRAPSSITDPVVEIDSSIDPNIYGKVNYAKIETFGRYYFITNIISTYNNLWEIHLHVDVLMSFAEQIKQQVAVVARQEENFNLYLDDGIFMAYQNPIIQTKLFSVEAPFETQNFILLVAGN